MSQMLIDCHELNNLIQQQIKDEKSSILPLSLYELCLMSEDERVPQQFVEQLMQPLK